MLADHWRDVPVRVFSDLCAPEAALARLQRDRVRRPGIRPVLVGCTSILTGECFLVRRWGVFVDGWCTGTIGTTSGGKTLRHGLAVLQWRDYERFDDGTPCRLGAPYLSRPAPGRPSHTVHYDPRCRAAWEQGSTTPAARRRPEVWPDLREDCEDCAHHKHQR